MLSGLYFYPNDVIEITKLKPSARGIKITDVNRTHLSNKRLSVKKMSRGFAWLDTGTQDSLLRHPNLCKHWIRGKMKVSCIEEIVFRMGYIDIFQLKKLAIG